VAFRADELHRLDIDNVSTIILGPNAIDREPDLLYDAKRIRDWVRRGGTLIVMHNPRAEGSQLLPFSIGSGDDAHDAVFLPDALVTSAGSSRLLEWPNKITIGDWCDWVGPRALDIPSKPLQGWPIPEKSQHPTAFSRRRWAKAPSSTPRSRFRRRWRTEFPGRCDYS
jgi:hypothetical protein